MTNLVSTPPIAFVIAGSEATGGAGIQVDLKTFQQLGVYGVGALSCIVAFDPNNGWGHRFHPVDPEIIASLDQIEDFRRAYEPGGMTPAEFDDFGATRKTLRQFLTADEELDQLVRDVITPAP